MNKPLLVPVDFSENAQTAVSYAAQIADISKRDVHVIHIMTEHTNRFANATWNKDLMEPLIKEALSQLDTFLLPVKARYPDIVFTTAIRDGVLTDQLLDEAKGEKYAAIVMGTKGSSGLDSVFIGSNAYDVIKTTDTPVLIVPKHIEALQLNNIGLLCNFKEGELEVLKQAVSLFGNKFHLQLIHINRADEDVETVDQKLKMWIDRIIKETQIDDISYIVKSPAYFYRNKETIAHAIQQILIDESVDMLLVTKGRKNFFRYIFSENIAKELAFQSKIPNLFARI